MTEEMYYILGKTAGAKNVIVTSDCTFTDEDSDGHVVITREEEVTDNG